jgi:methyl-accepting chemotaxis protein-1 (serine sensor receptor)
MLKNLSIKARLVATMGFMAIMLVVGGVMGIVGVQNANNALKEVYSVQLASATAINGSVVPLLQARSVLDRVALQPDAANAAAKIKHAEGFHEKAALAWKAYLALPASAEEKKLSDDVAVKREAYLREGALPLVAALRGGQRDEVERLMLDKIPLLFGVFDRSTQALMKVQSETAAALFESSQRTYEVFRMVAIGGVVLGLIGVAVFAYFLVRAIMQPLREALAHFDAIASGDLTTRVEVKSNNEMGALMKGLQKMQDSLIGTVRAVRESSGSIATASTQIAAGNQDLSSRTEEQASSLEETASSMEELTSTVQHNADNARQANQLSATASNVAAKGGAVVSKVVDTMAAINESSKKIVDIITVIDGIAFQTNILALNAAVEAARAGEQGRGFAVVASEVRNLAQRSASAAKEIKALIDNSVAKVDTGTVLVEQAGATISEVVESVRRVANIVEEIAAAGQEQSTGIEQVNQAIGQMDQVTQQNAALVEEAAAASEALNEQARHLAHVVSVFKLDEAQPDSAAVMRVKPESRKSTVATLPKAAPAAASSLPKPMQRRLGAAKTAEEAWETF